MLETLNELNKITFYPGVGFAVMMIWLINNEHGGYDSCFFLQRSIKIIESLKNN